MNRSRKRPKQRTAASHVNLAFSKNKQVQGNEIWTGDQLREHLAKKEKGEGGLQERVTQWLSENGIVSLRISDQLYGAIESHPTLPLWLKKKLLAEIAGRPDDPILIPIDGTQFNLCVCCEHKSKVGSMNANQRKFADTVNVNITRSLEQVRLQIEQAGEFLKDIAPVIEKYNEEEG